MTKPRHFDRTKFFDFSPDMLCVVDQAGKIVDLNAAWESTLGWTQHDLLGSSIYDRLLDQDMQLLKTAFADLQAGPCPAGFACNMLHKNTSTRYLYWSGRFDKESGTFLMSARDRTELRRGAEEFETAKKQLDKTFSVLSVGMIVFGSHGEVVRYNSAALRILGLTVEQLQRKTSFDSRWHAIDEDGIGINGEDLPARVAQRTGVPQSRTIGFYQPSGELRWTAVTADPIFNEPSEIPHQVLFTFDDLTEARNAIAKAQAQEEELARLIDHMPALISYWDQNLNNVLSNRSYANAHGGKPEDLVGRNFRKIVSQKKLAIAEEHVLNALDGIASSFETEIAFGPDDLRPALISYIPDFHGGKIVGFISVATDLSLLKRLEKDRQDFEVKFAAASKMSALGEMAAGIAHEINNPLAIINGKTSLLQMRIERSLFDPVKFDAELTSITNTVERIAKTVRGLLSFSRNSEGEAAQVTCVSSIVESTLDLCREKMRGRGVELRVAIDPLAEIDCRPHQISQIMMNLINNANDAVADLEEQWISIEVEVKPQTIHIRVTDSGQIHDPTVVEKLMNPFFTTKEIGRGTGLGLSISKGLAESHGGSLTYDKNSQNTSFVLELPRAGRNSRVLPKAG
ncbi:hypothetical protein BH10BDE1_BH10BDE1_34370 [soil metagenome]